MNSPRDLPSLNAIKAFEATARTGSVTSAAQELHVTHGAVSRQIRLLEESLACRLFERAGRGLSLTDAGRQLQATAGDCFAALRETCQRLRQPREGKALVLGCPGSLLARWMIPRLERLRHDLPGLDLHLSANEQAPEESMRGIDAALLSGEAPWPASWEVMALAPESIGPVCSPTLPAAARLRGAAADALLELPLLHTASRPQAWPAWARSQGLPVHALRLGQGFEHLYYLLEAAAAGLGVAIAPYPLVADELAAGRLLAPWGFARTGACWTLCCPRERVDPRLTALATWLRTQLAEDGCPGAA